MTIRQATMADVPTMVAIGHEMHQESIFSAFNFDEATVYQFIQSLIEGPHGIALICEGNDGEIVGGFMGMVWPHFFGKDLQATDVALFMRKQFRSGTAGLKLIKAYIEEAKSKGAAQIVLANSTGFQKEKVATLFERMGFEQVGYVYSMNATKEIDICV